MFNVYPDQWTDEYEDMTREFCKSSIHWHEHTINTHKVIHDNNRASFALMFCHRTNQMKICFRNLINKIRFYILRTTLKTRENQWIIQYLEHFKAVSEETCQEPCGNKTASSEKKPSGMVINSAKFNNPFSKLISIFFLFFFFGSSYGWGFVGVKYFSVLILNL